MIVIDHNDKRPIYEQIAERFRELILCGALEPNEKLPSVRALAVELSINPNTIQRALSLLEQDGFIYSVKGVGNFVREGEHLWKKQREWLLAEFENYVKKCVKQGISREELMRRLVAAAGEVKL